MIHWKDISASVQICLYVLSLCPMSLCPNLFYHLYVLLCLTQEECPSTTVVCTLGQKWNLYNVPNEKFVAHRLFGIINMKILSIPPKSAVCGNTIIAYLYWVHLSLHSTQDYKYFENTIKIYTFCNFFFLEKFAYSRKMWISKVYSKEMWFRKNEIVRWSLTVFCVTSLFSWCCEFAWCEKNGLENTHKT